MMKHGSYETRYDILLGPGDKGASTGIGPAFKFDNVDIYDLNLTGANQPDSIGTGDRLHFVAEVGEFNPTTCLFFLRPVSTKSVRPMPRIITDRRARPISVTISIVLTVTTLGYFVPWMIAAQRGTDRRRGSGRLSRRLLHAEWVAERLQCLAEPLVGQDRHRSAMRTCRLVATVDQGRVDIGNGRPAGAEPALTL